MFVERCIHAVSSDDRNPNISSSVRIIAVHEDFRAFEYEVGIYRPLPVPHTLWPLCGASDPNDEVGRPELPLVFKLWSPIPELGDPVGRHSRHGRRIATEGPR